LGQRIPSVLISTNAKIHHHFPHILYDSSRRDVIVTSGSSTIKYLHRPIILQETMDIWARSLVVGVPYMEYVLSKEFVTNLFKHGRPYWGALLEKNSQDFPLAHNEVLELAREKLLGGHSKIPSDVDALSLLGQTMYIEPLATSDYGSQLIEARLGFCQVIDNFQHNFVAAVYPEPVLAVVAAKTLLSLGTNSLRNCLSRYSQMTSLGQADIGADGEFVVRVGFWIAQMLASPHPQISYTRHLQFHAAYPRLFGHVLAQLATIPRAVSRSSVEFVEGIVGFTHWIRIDSLVRQSATGKISLSFKHSLEQALVRSAAIILPKGFEDVNLAIPIVLKGGDLGAVLIQVKNYTDDSAVVQDQAVSKMFLFARESGLEGKCLYILAFTSPKRETAPATITAFHGNMTNALRKNVNIGRSENVPGFIMKGINYDFGQSKQVNLKTVGSSVEKSEKPMGFELRVTLQSVVFCLTT
jgi:hypothetical protein